MQPPKYVEVPIPYLQFRSFARERGVDDSIPILGNNYIDVDIWKDIEERNRIPKRYENIEVMKYTTLFIMGKIKVRINTLDARIQQMEVRIRVYRGYKTEASERADLIQRVKWFKQLKNVYQKLFDREQAYYSNLQQLTVLLVEEQRSMHKYLIEAKARMMNQAYKSLQNRIASIRQRLEDAPESTRKNIIAYMVGKRMQADTTDEDA